MFNANKINEAKKAEELKKRKLAESRKRDVVSSSYKSSADSSIGYISTFDSYGSCDSTTSDCSSSCGCD